MSQAFSARLLRWHRQHGRHDLPWQHPRSPYRVWLSEVMLQQTQVATVIPYFQRFVARFADLPSLAAANQDDVLSLWSGLGYYARARNLLHCAQTLMRDFGGEFPRDPRLLETLPGIGRSTANAIAAQSWGSRWPILDGNVKRVLARHAGVPGWPGKTEVSAQLWRIAEQRTPQAELADYTQAIMDLGASCCRLRKPNCEACPVAEDCVARNEDRVAELPTPRPRRERPRRVQYLQIWTGNGEILLQRRPPSGIWGGLWCPPLHEAADQVQGSPLPALQHAFTHFELELRPYLAAASNNLGDADSRWFSIEAALDQGLPAPIRRLLHTLELETV